MKIKYGFVTGEKVVIEVPDDIGIVIQESRRKEHADNERHRYHAEFSLDDAVYEGSVFSSPGTNPADVVSMKESDKECEDRLSRLTPVQRRRIEKLMDGMSIADIARSEGAAFNTVKESIESARKKLKKFM